MPIVVRCERCGQRYQVGDQLAGRSLNCKGCGAVMGVPAAGSGADAGLAPLDLGGPAGADVNGLFGAAPAAPSPYGARPAAPAPYGQAAPYGQPSPYGQPAGPYGQPASPYAQPNPTGHQPTGGGLGYQYPAPAPINSPYLNGPAPLSQPAGFDLPGLPAMPGMPMARKPADDGAGVVPYIVAAIVAGVVLFVGMAFLLFSGGKSSDPQVAGLGAPPQHVVMPPPPRVVPPTPVGRGAPLGAPSTNSSASRPVAIRPSGAGDLAAPSAQPEKTTAEAPKYVPPKRGDLGAPSAGGAEDEKPAPSGLASAPAASAFADGAMSPTGEATNPGGGPPVSNLGWQLELPENVPTWEFKKNWSMRLSLPRSHGEVAFASENRPFVAFASTSDKSPWEVWDLAGLKRVGAYKGSLALAKEGALSPSGKKIAAKSDGFRSGGTVYVVDVSSGKTLNELQVGDNDAPKFFCGDDWLVTQVWGSGELTVYDLAQSQEAYKIGGRFSLDPGKYAVVPGGKYFLIAQDDKIIAFETATGARAGELRSEGFSHNFKGFAVSWDAKELAVLYSDGKFVATFDLATGDQTGDIKLNEAAADPPFGHWCKVNPIQWLPAREGWLLNAHAVVDRESGGPVWVIPAGKSGGSKVGPIVLPNYTVIGPEDTWETSVVSVALPKEKIADAARAVRAGGEATDAALPPITLAKIDGVQTFAVADGAENWTVKPDPAGGKKLMAAPMTLKSPLKNIHEVEFASPSSGMLVMGCGEEQHGNRAANGASWIDRYDVAGGRSSGRMDLPLPGKLLAVSPDGSQVAIGYGRTCDRLDVYSAADRKHVVGFRPYSRPAGSEENRHSPRQSPESLWWAGFVDNEHLLTLNHSPKSLVLWKLPECQAMYEMALPTELTPTYTPGGKYVVLSNGATIDFLDPLAGKIVGQVSAAPRGRVLSTRPAIHESGLRMAAVARDVLMVWNLETGEMLGDLDVQTNHVGRVQWCGDKHVLLDEALFDLARSCVVWTYRQQNWTVPGLKSSTLPDSRAWSFASDPTGKTGYLLAKALPEPQLREAVDKMIPLDRAPVFGPGNKVKLSVSFGGPADDLKKLNDGLAQIVTADGAVLGDDPSAFTLRITNNVIKSETVEYTSGPRFGPRIPPFPGSNMGGSQTLTVVTLECEFALVDPQGKVIWTRKTTVGGGASPVIFGDVSQYQNTHWTQALSFFLGCRMPREVFEQPRKKLADNTEILGLGWSQWGPSGPTPQP